MDNQTLYTVAMFWPCIGVVLGLAGGFLWTRAGTHSCG